MASDGRRGRQLHERGHHVEVERARVDLADAGRARGRSRGGRRPRARAAASFAGVAAEQVEHVLRRADRALDAAQRVAARAGRRAGRAPTSSSSATVANRLPSVVACAATLCERPAITSASYSAARRASRASTASALSPHQLQRLAHLQLLDVLGQVAAGHALVDVLVPGQRGELLDPRLDVVPGDPLARGDGVEVDVVDHRSRRPRSRRRARRRRGRAGRAARRATAGARGRSCARATRSRPGRGAGVARGQDVRDHRLAFGHPRHCPWSPGAPLGSPAGGERSGQIDGRGSFARFSHRARRTRAARSARGASAHRSWPLPPSTRTSSARTSLPAPSSGAPASGRWDPRALDAARADDRDVNGHAAGVASAS